MLFRVVLFRLNHVVQCTDNAPDGEDLTVLKYFLTLSMFYRSHNQYPSPIFPL